VLEQHEGSGGPKHLKFVEPSKRWAHVIIPRGGHDTVAIDRAATRIEQLLYG
jgi:uridine kinase